MLCHYCSKALPCTVAGKSTQAQEKNFSAFCGTSANLCQHHVNSSCGLMEQMLTGKVLGCR